MSIENKTGQNVLNDVVNKLRIVTKFQMELLTLCDEQKDESYQIRLNMLNIHSTNLTYLRRCILLILEQDDIKIFNYGKDILWNINDDVSIIDIAENIHFINVQSKFKCFHSGLPKNCEGTELPEN